MYSIWLVISIFWNLVNGVVLMKFGVNLGFSCCRVVCMCCLVLLLVIGVDVVGLVVGVEGCCV